MNLFFARLTGRLMNAEKAEQNNANLLASAKRYRQIEASAEWKEYHELVAAVASEKFAQKKAELSGRKHQAEWQASEEGKQEARLASLKKNADIVWALKANVRQIEEIESWHQTWVADFHETSLLKNGFKSGFWFKQASLKTDFSYAGEALAYMGERNVRISNGVLSIVTKKEQATASAWDGKVGFRQMEFPYTSAIINTGDTFKQPVGMFVAKVRATGKCHSAIYLVGENRFPVVELFHYNGKKLVVGLTDKNGHEREVIGGINCSDWQILSVAVNRQEIVWSLNNLEVFRTKNPLPGQALYFSALSFAQAGKASEGVLEIAYLKAFER